MIVVYITSSGKVQTYMHELKSEQVRALIWILTMQLYIVIKKREIKFLTASS